MPQQYDNAAQYGTRPDLCIYAGVPAAMFWPTPTRRPTLLSCAPRGRISAKSRRKRLVLISSIAVLADSRGVYEDSPAQDT